jgi:hypothetical protein
MPYSAPTKVLLQRNDGCMNLVLSQYETPKILLVISHCTMRIAAMLGT